MEEEGKGGARTRGEGICRTNVKLLPTRLAVTRGHTTFVTTLRES